MKTVITVSAVALLIAAIILACAKQAPGERLLIDACVGWEDHPFTLCLDDRYIYRCDGGPDGEIIEECPHGCFWDDIVGPTGGTVFAECAERQEKPK
jgi:hypothetical protein